MKFTKATTESVVCPKGRKEHYEWDEEVPGFGLRAYPSGKKVWVARYRAVDGRQRKLTIGDARNMAFDKARKAAQNALAAARLGGDPAEEKAKARKRIRVSELVRLYLEAKGAKLAPAWLAAVKRQLEKQAAPLHHEIAETVHRSEIAKLLETVKRDVGPVASNRLRASLSAMWTWGIKSGLIDAAANPVAATAMPAGPERARERVLSDAELALIWRCTASGGVHDRIVRLLILTGARKNEIAGGRWPEILIDNSGKGGLWTLPGSRSKNGLPHEIPLGPLTIEQLPKRVEGADMIFGNRPTENSKSDEIRSFSGWSASKARLDEKMHKALTKELEGRHQRKTGLNEIQIEHWTLHDLRRTFATRNSDNGVDPHIVEAMLNHVSGSAKRGVAGIYNRSAYRAQKRAALMEWELYIRKLIGVETGG